VKLRKATKDVSQDSWSVGCILLHFKFSPLYLRIYSCALLRPLVVCEGSRVMVDIHCKLVVGNAYLCTPHHIFIIRTIKSRRIRSLGHVECRNKGGEKECIQVLVGKPEGKGLLGRPRRWEDNIRMDLQEVYGGAWTELIRSG